MRKVEVSIDVGAIPARAISAFTDSTTLREWWGVERTLIDKRPGGLYTLAWSIHEKGFGFVSTGIIKDYRPDRGAFQIVAPIFHPYGILVRCCFLFYR